MSLYSEKIINGMKKQFNNQKKYNDIEEICVNIAVDDEFYTACFIIDEDEEFLTFLHTNSDGREKLKIANKKYVKTVHILYLDDKNNEEKQNQNEDSVMFY